MPEVYQQWENSFKAAFHYVSGSPYQLYDTLVEFMENAKLPQGSMYLKTARVELLEPLEYDFIKLFMGVESFKLGHILPLVRKYPKRKFVLVGDSGEKDPEVYSKVFDTYPNQILCIYIREVEGSDLTEERFSSAFRNVPAAQWRRFKDPSILRKADFSSPQIVC